MSWRRVRHRCSVPVKNCGPDKKPGYRLPRGRELRRLRRDAKNPNAMIRFYYIRSVKWRNDNQPPGLYQYGNGLNLRGGIATLCTCKHDMLRAIYKQWNGTKKHPPLYVGVLGSKDGRRPGSKSAPLVFFGRVEQSFETFIDIWNSMPPDAQRAKSVQEDPLGDLYPDKLVEEYERKGQLGMEHFAPGYIHHKDEDDKDYKKDLDESKPLLFAEWRAWPDADMILNGEMAQMLPDPKRQNFRRMVKKPGPSRYGWVYPLKDLKPFVRHVMKK